MINPDDVNLIIFDMDGTIADSLPPVYEAMKRAFTKLGWPVNFSAEGIKPFFGQAAPASGGGVYEFIRPEGSPLTWEEIRLKVREEYHEVFREQGACYPGVKVTLASLRKRDYRLVQYSNSSARYLNTVIDALGLRDYYDHIECVQERGITKTELVRKIREQFGGLTAAVVGDRIHDIEAARETGSLSIGVLFGYGGEEPKQADITIGKFDDLLTIFDRRLPIFEKIAAEIDTRRSKDRPIIVGISGIDNSGKTMFTKALASYMVGRNCKVQVIHLDDFHNPWEVRYAGENQAENYYNRSFDIQKIINKLLVPARRKIKHTITLTLLDLNTDKYEIEKEFSFDSETTVLFEGVFLFRRELAPYIDYQIYLDISFEESKKRALERDAAAIINKYDTKYLPAQAKYLEEYPPHNIANIIIDNSNWEYPRISLP